jgi:hypothetical protein
MISNKIVDIWRAPLVDDGAYGTKRDWTARVLVASLPASVQPILSIRMASEEKNVDRETVTTKQRVYVRWRDVLSTDRVLIDGEWWEVWGDPEDWAAPITMTNTGHVRMLVRKVTH